MRASVCCGRGIWLLKRSQAEEWISGCWVSIFWKVIDQGGMTRCHFFLKIKPCFGVTMAFGNRRVAFVSC